MADLRLERLSMRFDEQLVVDALELSVDDGELLTLLGPSGSGKTTVLRLVAGYLAPKFGRVVVGGKDVTNEPPETRNIGMVFQSYALFPHRTVFRNVSFGLERRRVPKPEREDRVREALARVQLDAFRNRFPNELSGGQQQRVALARALVIQPTLLLLDEPLSNLDAKLRSELRLEIRRLQKELGITTVLVTHDQEEALAVSDRVALLDRGRLQQIDTPDALYHRPANRFVAEFIGKMNVLTAEAEPDKVGAYRLPSGERLHAVPDPAGGPHVLCVRPEAVRLGAPSRANDAKVNRVRGTLVRRVFLGEIVELTFLLSDGSELLYRGSELSSSSLGNDREPVELWWDVDKTRAVPEASPSQRR